MFDGISDALGAVAAWFYDIYASYGFAIAGLTIVIYTILTPLTLKANRSMMAMQEYQPELKRIQQKYKDDRQKQQQEMVAFYQEHGINPLGGCIPILVQLPVFFLLFRVIRGLTRLGEDGTFDPDHLSESSALYQSLDEVSEMLWLGIDLSVSLNEKLSEDALGSIPWIMLVAVYAVVTWYAQHQLRARQRNSNTQMPGFQQTIMKWMPVMIVAFSIIMPAGIVVYFIVSSSFRVAQQAYIRWSNDQREAKKAEAKKQRPATKADGGEAPAKDDDGASGGGGTGNDGQAPHPKSRQSGKRKRRR